MQRKFSGSIRFIVVAVFLFLVTSISTGEQSPTPEILFYANFDSTLNAAIAKGDTKAYTNSAISLTEGKFGNGVELKDGQVLKYKVDKNLSKDGGTFSIWFKPDFVLPDSYYEENKIVYLFSVLGDNWNNRMDFRTGSFHYFFVKRDGGLNQECLWTMFRAIWDNSDWHLATITWDSTVIKEYFDGELKDYLYHTGLPSNLKGYFNIGSSQDGKLQMTGVLDDAVILNAPLTEKEISQYYLSRKPFLTFWDQWLRSGKTSTTTSSETPNLISLVKDHSLNGVRIYTSKEGVYKVSYDALKKQSVPVEKIDSRHIQITLQEKDIPFIIHSSDTTRFQPGDWIEFVASDYSDEYQKENVYQLTWDKKNNEDLSHYKVLSISPTQTNAGTKNLIQNFQNSLHLEENYYFKDFIYRPDTATDVWFWLNLTAPSKQDIQFNLPQLVSDTSHMAQFQICLQGYSYPNVHPNHHVLVHLNRTLIGDIRWDGQKQYIFENFQVPTSCLSTGKNTMTFEAPGDIDSKKTLSNPLDVSFLNWVNIRYWQQLEPSQGSLIFTLASTDNNSDATISLQGLAKSNYRIFNPDEKIVAKIAASTDDEPNPVLNIPVRSFSASTGQTERYILLSDQTPLLEPTTIEPMWKFDLYNTANAADYLIITHRNFYDVIKPLAQYREKQGLKTKIVTVDAVYDEFNHGFFSPQAIRDFIEYTEKYWHTPPRYVLLVGDASFDYLDNSRKHVPCYIPTYDWHRQNSYRSGQDNWFIEKYANDSSKPLLSIGRFPVNEPEEVTRMTQRIMDYESDSTDAPWKHNVLMIAGIEPMFHQNSDELIQKFPSSLNPYKLYMDGNTVTKAIDTAKRERVLNELNDGRVMVHFTGHGGGGIWADKELFLLEDIKKLTNDHKLPLIFSLTCYSADFDSPFTNCLGEEMVRSKTGGAIAFYGASTLSMAYDNFSISRTLFDVLFNEKERTLGDIIQKTRRKLKSQGMSMDNVDIYNLLGDPALRVQLPSS